MPEKINLQRSYSNLNEHLAKQFDSAGARRNFTVPYISGQDMATHVAAVGQAATESGGGLTNSLLTTHHTAAGKGWGSEDGATIGHPSDKLRTTVITKDNEDAKATIAAAQKHLSNVAALIGEDDPSVKTAQGQLDLVKKASGAGMNLLDFGVMMTQLMYGPNQAVARAHSGTKEGGHAPHLRAPGAPTAPEGQESPAETQDGASGGGETSEDQPAAPEAQGASQAASAPQPAGGAAPQQG